MMQLAILAAATTAGLLPAWPEPKRARHLPRPRHPTSALRAQAGPPWHGRGTEHSQSTTQMGGISRNLPAHAGTLFDDHN
jgi:hypothetical protein